MVFLMLTDVLGRTRPALICLGGLCSDYAFLQDALLMIRKLSPGVPVVLGGGIVTNDAEFIFNDLKPDYAIAGEGEESLVRIATNGLS